MIEIVSCPTRPPAAKVEAILARRSGVSPEVEQTAREILAAVRTRGDEAHAEAVRIRLADERSGS